MWHVTKFMSLSRNHLQMPTTGWGTEPTCDHMLYSQQSSTCRLPHTTTYYSAHSAREDEMLLAIQNRLCTVNYSLSVTLRYCRHPAFEHLTMARTCVPSTTMGMHARRLTAGSTPRWVDTYLSSKLHQELIMSL